MAPQGNLGIARLGRSAHLVMSLAITSEILFDLGHPEPAAVVVGYLDGPGAAIT